MTTMTTTLLRMPVSSSFAELSMVGDEEDLRTSPQCVAARSFSFSELLPTQGCQLARSASFAELSIDGDDVCDDGSGDEDRFVIRDNVISDECVLYLSSEALATSVGAKPRDTTRVATKRGGGRVATHERLVRDGACPFCPGNEARCAAAAAEVLDGSGAWVARCFENRFPIFHPLGSGSRAGARGARATARMEVLVATPRHDRDLAQLSAAERGAVVRLARDRAADAATSAGCRHVRVFSNHGSRAGGSLQHAHWQVVGLGFVPPRARHLLRAQRRAASACGGSCAVCARLAALDEAIVVYRDARAVAFAAVAPQSGTFWVAPLKCAASLVDADDAVCVSLGAALQRVAKLTYDCYDDPDYNVAFASRPVDDGEDPFHFYAVFTPHLKEDCSLATLQYGLPISHCAPEEAAARLLAAAS